MARYSNIQENKWTGINYTDEKETVSIGFGFCDDIGVDEYYTQRFATPLVKALRPDLFNN